MNGKNTQFNLVEHALKKYMDEQIHLYGEYEKLLIKSVMLLNTGSAATILGFIASPLSTDLIPEVILILISALAFFIAGTIFASRGILHKFLSYSTFVSEVLNQKKKEASEQDTDDFFAHFYNISTINIRVSFGLFVTGAFLSVGAILIHFRPLLG